MLDFTFLSEAFLSSWLRELFQENSVPDFVQEASLNELTGAL